MQAGEGCHLFGKLLVNKVAGNFHIAPGKSFQQVRLLLGFWETVPQTLNTPPGVCAIMCMA